MPHDNVDIAILTKLNQLAECYGLKPYDFVATIVLNDSPTMNALQFETVPENIDTMQRMATMMAAIGLKSDESLRGTDAEIYEALEGALRRAPRSRQMI